jgi:predicted GNAT family N-acyltransferase
MATTSNAAMRKKTPFYVSIFLSHDTSVLAIRMGRLAVDVMHKGIGLAAALLADALDRAARAEIVAYALVVGAKDEIAAAFYQHHGFIALPDSPNTLFLPLATVPIKN